MKKGFIGLLGILAGTLAVTPQVSKINEPLKVVQKKKGQKILPKEPPKEKGTFKSRYEDFLIKAGRVKRFNYTGFTCIARTEKNADKKYTNFIINKLNS